MGFRTGSAYPSVFMRRLQEFAHQSATARAQTGLLQVAIWDGIVCASGVGISMYSDFRVVTERTALSVPEVSVGVIPSFGTTHSFSRLRAGAECGTHLLLSGTKVGAADC